ncbi:MAG TPA: protoglobin domain-containing protein [Anaerolineae bacterium]|nr:protoglobin domain-containing protein [Anaerolineae bacterium]
MSFDIAQMRRYGGLSDADAALLAEMKPALEKHADAWIDSFYEQLDEFDTTKNLLEGRRDTLKTHLRAWILSLATGQYGDAYLERRYKIGVRHVEVGLDPRWVIGAMSFCRGQIGPVIEAEYGDAADKMARYLALDRVMDLDLNIMLQSYDDRRMDLFLETTGFSKALFESMIGSAGD